MYRSVLLLRRTLALAVLFSALWTLYGCESDTVGDSDFTVSPSSLTFGDVNISTKRRLSVKITNTSGIMQYPLPSIVGADASAFSVVYQPAVLLNGDDDSVVVEFAPVQKRSYAAELQIGSESVVTVALSGKGVDPTAPYDLSLESQHTQQAPVVDGSGSDAAWALAQELVLDLAQVQPGAPQSPYKARLRSLNDGVYVYFLIRIDDATRNDSPNQIQLKGSDPSAESNWTVQTNGQDAMSMMFAATADVYGSSSSQTFATAGCNVACHSAQSLLNYESGSYPGNGMIDLWYWQAGLTNPQGYADDQFAFGNNGSSFRNERRPDVGADFAVSNFARAGTAAPLNVAGGANNGLNAAQYIWDATSVVFTPLGSNPATAAAWATGDIVPGWRLRSEAITSSRNNVEARGVYSDGGWTVELRRKLNTGNDDDAQFSRNTDVPFAFAYFDNTRKYARFEYAALAQKPAPSHFGSNPGVIYLLIR